MVELDELAVGLDALGVAHRPRGGLPSRGQPPPGGAMAEIIEIRGEPVGPHAVGPALGLQLQQAELHPDLDDRAAVAGPDFPGEDLAGIGLVGPIMQSVVDVPSHRRPAPPSPSHRPVAHHYNEARRAGETRTWRVVEPATRIPSPGKMAGCTRPT